MSIGVAVSHADASLVVDVVDAIDRAEGMHVVPSLADAAVVLAGGGQMRSAPGRGLVVLSAGDAVDDVRAGFEAGARGWLRWPRDASDLGRVVALAARDVRADDTPRGHVIGIKGARGGAGTSTVACLLAASHPGALIIDLGGGQRAWAPDDVVRGSLARVLAAPLPEVIEQAAQPHAAGRALYGDGTPVDAHALAAVLEAARVVAPSVIVDPLPSGTDVDRVLLVCADDLASLRAARAILDDGSDVEVILNRFRKGAIRSRHVERGLGRKPLGVITRSPGIARAADLGVLPRRRVRGRVARWLS